MHPTSIIQKLIPSVMNVFIVLVVASPFLFLKVPVFNKKIVLISLFLIYNLAFVFFNHGRDFGMMIVGSYWKENYPIINLLIYSILYTASFSTLLFWIYFPFDLFLANMVLIQLPTVILTGTTLHGLLSGRMVSVIK
jgi:hypothetical protein